MKKIIIVFFLLLNVLIVEKVNAQTYNLILDRQEGIYYSRSGGDLPYYASQFIIYRLGNEIAYCIEPSKNITTYNYVDSGGYINLPYSDEIKRKIQLIGYFGREYPGQHCASCARCGRDRAGLPRTCQKPWRRCHGRLPPGGAAGAGHAAGRA